MDPLLCKSDLSAARNSLRGSSRNACATRISGASSRSGASSGRGCSDTNMACTASSSCKARERLAMATLHLRSQILHRTQLQLLNGPRGLPQPRRNLPYTALLHKSLVHHPLLNLRKLAHQLEQLRTMLNGAQLRGLQLAASGSLSLIVAGWELTGGALRLVNDGIGGDAQKPRCKRDPAPFVARQIGERFVEHLGSKILRRGAIANPAGKEGVDTLEIQIVERVEFCRITLRCLDEHTLVLGLRHRLAGRSSCGHHGSRDNNCREGERLRYSLRPRSCRSSVRNRRQRHPARDNCFRPLEIAL